MDPAPQDDSQNQDATPPVDNGGGAPEPTTPPVGDGAGDSGDAPAVPPAEGENEEQNGGGDAPAA